MRLAESEITGCVASRRYRRSCMSSHWVQDDLDLVKWVDRTVTNAGAYWASAKPGWMIGPVTVTGSTGDRVGVVLKTNNYAVFSDDTRLKVEFSAYNSESAG